MITFRYHIVSLVSVFLALAIGIALGGGPLKGEVDNSLVKELAARKKIQTEQRRRSAGSVPPRRSPTATPRRPRRPSSRAGYAACPSRW